MMEIQTPPGYKRKWGWNTTERARENMAKAIRACEWHKLVADAHAMEMLEIIKRKRNT